MPLKQSVNNNHAPLQVVMDAERMKYPNTGLYAFCKHLGCELMKLPDLKPAFYQEPTSASIWENHPIILEKQFWHKWWMPNWSGYDVWHATYQGTNYFPFSFSGKILLTIHDINFMHENKSDAKKSKYLQQLQKKINRADALSFISQYVYEDVANHLNIEGKRTKVIYNGCNSLENVISKQPVWIQQRESFLFSIGTIHEKKNFHLLIPMMQFNEHKLVISGTIVQPAYFQQLKNMIDSLGLQDRVVLSGPVTDEEKKWLYENCRAFLFPSKAEGFGMPVIEAMESGACCVLSTYTCLPEIGKSYASYFDHFDAQYMSSIVEVAIQLWTEEKKMAAYKHARSFQWNQVAAEYAAFYKELIAL